MAMIKPIINEINGDETAQDIFESWKNRKFIVIENLNLDIPKNRCIIILSDLEYWNKNYDELKEWCYKYGGVVKGMTVEINYELAAIFALRWS